MEKIYFDIYNPDEPSDELLEQIMEEGARTIQEETLKYNELREQRLRDALSR